MAILILLALVGFIFGLERVLHYCGYIELLRPADTNVPLPFKGYVSPAGIEPDPPESCVWAIFEIKKGSEYTPTLVVISRTKGGYRADIYSDPERIFGHRQGRSVDSSPSGIDIRVKEMENYLSLAAGSRVLKEALKALKDGKSETSFQKVVPLALPFAPTLPQRFVALYRLYDIRWADELPKEVRELVDKGRSKNVRHSKDWNPISVPADLVEN